MVPRCPCWPIIAGEALSTVGALRTNAPSRLMLVFQAQRACLTDGRYLNSLPPDRRAGYFGRSQGTSLSLSPNRSRRREPPCATSAFRLPPPLYDLRRIRSGPGGGSGFAFSVKAGGHGGTDWASGTRRWRRIGMRRDQEPMLIPITALVIFSSLIARWSVIAASQRMLLQFAACFGRSQDVAPASILARAAHLAQRG
jgi:hypothetical protein